MKISIFGTGYVGLVTGACLANLGHEILCADIDQNKINLLKQGIVPFHEPRLKELVASNLSKGRLKFTTDLKEAAIYGVASFNCVGTPSKEDGSANLEYIFSVAKTIAENVPEDQYKILINKSTVPPGTAKTCQDLILSINSNSKVEVVSNPEFLKEGNAVHDFNHPDKIVIGAQSDKAKNLARKIYTGLLRIYIPMIETDWATSEMIKYANNSFLATKISFINEMANISDLIGADIKIIAQAMGLDYRISPKFLQAGIGYGGSCFPKDIRALVDTSKKRGYFSNLLKEVDLVNSRQKEMFLNKILKKFNGEVNNKILTIWGLSFKPKTSDVRESPSIYLINELQKRGAIIKAYDPVANEEMKTICPTTQYFDNIKDSVIKSSAIVLVTDWNEFRNVDFKELEEHMKEKVIFDGRNIYIPKLVKEDNFEYYGIGRR